MNIYTHRYTYTYTYTDTHIQSVNNQSGQFVDGRGVSHFYFGVPSVPL